MEQLDERCVLKIALIMVRIKRDQLYSHRAANVEKKRRFSDRSSANGFLFFLSFCLAASFSSAVARATLPPPPRLIREHKTNPRPANRPCQIAACCCRCVPPAIGERLFKCAARATICKRQNTHTLERSGFSIGSSDSFSPATKAFN